MTELLVRRLPIDLETPFAGRWNGGDTFGSAFFNALSNGHVGRLRQWRSRQSGARRLFAVVGQAR